MCGYTNHKRDLNEKSRFFFDLLPSELHIVIKSFFKHQKDIYIIGGAVRDFLFGEPIGDFDLATNARPEQITKYMNEVRVKTKPIGKKFGTVLAIVGKKAFDISTFRHEHFKILGEPPEVNFVESLEEDLVRRDFTINTIAFDPKNMKFIDKFGGIDDIQNNRLRVIGDAFIRFNEDGLRIIRFARFMSQFNLTPDSVSLNAIADIGNTARFRNPDALRIELFKILDLPNPSSGLKLLWKNEIFDTIFSKFPFSKSQNMLLVLDEGINRFNEIPRRQILIRLFGLLILFADESTLSQDNWLQIGNNLNLSQKQREILNRLYQSWITFPSDPLSRELKHWVRRTGINTSEDILPLIFLKAKIFEDSKISDKKELFSNKVYKLLTHFRRTPDDD
ncbi:MAG: CCA tRNA nucleotidyltransferase [Candidatus Hodarchaeota archaeon]